jgi:acyl dehydratase
VFVGYDRIRFVRPVFFGDTVTTEYRIVAVDREKRRICADLRRVNQRGDLVASGPHVRAFVD